MNRSPATRTRSHISTVADFMADKIVDEKCDLVLVAGDLFKDARVFLDRASVEIAAAVRWLRRFSEAGIPVVVISGTPSHDAVAAYELIKEMRIPGVEIFTTPGVFEYGCSIACLPGINRSTMASKEEFSKLPAHELHQLMTERVTQAVRGLEAECANDFKIFMAHITCTGADKGFEDLLQQQEPVLTSEAVEGSGFDIICLGHIHKPQVIKGLSVPTYYCGSPERLSFNEELHTPGFYIHNLGTGRGSEWTINPPYFVQTPARNYCTLQFDLHDKDTEAFDRWCSFITGEKGAEYLIDREDSIVRVRYKVTEAQAKQINQAAIVKALHDAGAFYVQGVEAEVVRSTRTRAAEADAGMTPTEALAMWGRVNAVEDEELAELTTRVKVLQQEVGIGG